MKPTDVKSSTYIDFGVESNDKDPKFKVGDHVGISKCKNIFAKGCTRNWLEFVLLKMLKILYCGHILLVILMKKKLLERFLKNNCKKIKHSSELKW